MSHPIPAPIGNQPTPRPYRLPVAADIRIRSGGRMRARMRGRGRTRGSGRNFGMLNHNSRERREFRFRCFPGYGLTPLAVFWCSLHNETESSCL